MSATLISDTTTHGIRVGAAGFYLPDESTPGNAEYVFGYKVVIVNDSDVSVTLHTRHWDIIDAKGNRRQVDGDGVIGKMPHLSPGEAFRYHSFAVLPTTWGTMEGHYTMTTSLAEDITVEIGRFYLTDQSAQRTQPCADDAAFTQDSDNDNPVGLA